MTDAIIRDGRYEARFGTTLGYGAVIMELRNGVMSGQTSTGVPLEGWCRFDPARNLVSYELVALVPPHHDTLSGLSTYENGRRVLMKGEKAIGQNGQRFSLGFAGRAVDIAMRYIGPIHELPADETHPRAST